MNVNSSTNGYSLKGAQMIRDTKGLTLQERAILQDANVRANAQHQFWIKIDTWADALGVSDRTLKAHIASVIKKGLLYRQSRYGRCNLYTVLPNGKAPSPSGEHKSSLNGQNPSPSNGKPTASLKTTSIKDNQSQKKIELLDGEPTIPVGIKEKTDISGKKQGKKTGSKDIKAAAFDLAEAYYKGCCTSPKARVAFWSRLKRLRWPNLPSSQPKYHYHPDQVNALKSAMFGNSVEVRRVCHAIAHAICVWDPTQGENGKKAYPSPSDIVGQHFDESVIGLLKAVKDGAWPVWE